MGKIDSGSKSSRLLASRRYTHNTLTAAQESFTNVLDLMHEKGLDNVLLVGGGIIPKKDIDDLETKGVGKLFGPGTPVQTTVDYIIDWVNKNRR